MSETPQMDPKLLGAEARKAQREEERNTARTERGERWRGRWDKFKSGVNKAWEVTKSGINAVPEIPSRTKDLVEDVYDASADFVNRHAVSAVDKINNVTTNLGDEVTAASNFINTLGKSLKTQYAQERLAARSATLEEVAKNIVAPEQVTEKGAQDKLLAGMETAEQLQARIEALQEELRQARAKKGKLKQAGGWLKRFLN